MKRIFFILCFFSILTIPLLAVEVEVKEVSYEAGTFEGKSVTIFGYYCFPKDYKNPLPAVLIVHGGGGTANKARGIEWARRGYANLSIDLPGTGEGRSTSRSTGPNFDLKNIFDSNYLDYAVIAAREGVSFLSRRKEVDKERIGMLGVSWGGVITLMVNGLDQRLNSSVVVYGSGYLNHGSTWQQIFDEMDPFKRKAWEKAFDPKNFLASHEKPILFITGTNDGCFYLPIFMRTYLNSRANFKSLLLDSNHNHKISNSARENIFLWFDHKLKGEGSLTKISFLDLFQKKNHLMVPIKIEGKDKKDLKRVRLVYSQGLLNRWTKKNWKFLSARFWQGIWWVKLPIDKLQPEVVFYAVAEDQKGGITTTPIKSVFGLIVNERRHFVTSGVIKKINFHEARLESLAYLMGAKSEFNQETKTITLKRGKQELSMTLGTPEAMIDNQKFLMEDAPILEEGKVYLPLKSVFKAFKMSSFAITPKGYVFNLPELEEPIKFTDSLKKREEVLSRFLLFSSLDDDQLKEIVDIMQIQEYASAEVVFQANEAAHHIYILGAGRVSLRKGDEILKTKDLAGDYLSASPIFTVDSYPYLAKTEKKSVIYAISKEKLASLLRKNPQITETIIDALSRSLYD